MNQRRAVVAIVAVVLALLPLKASAASECPLPRCRELRVPVPKGLKVPDNHIRVLLPDGYDKSKARYPVVYLLHGVGDNYRSWTALTDVVAFTKRTKAIVVMPDGGSGSNAGWYSDWKDRSRQWETFHTKILLTYIDRNFRTLGKGHRAAIGISMGGFGAMKYAARHKGMFRAAASFSGMVDSMYGWPASGPFFHHAGQGIGGQSLGTPNENVWGDQVSDEDRWRAHNPTDLAAAFKGVWLYVATGTGAPGGPAGEDPTRPHSYANENFIWQMNLNFTRALDEAGVRYTSDTDGGGYHHWPYWQHQLHQALPKVLNVIR